MQRTAHAGGAPLYCRLMQKSAAPYASGFCGLLPLCTKDALQDTCNFAKKNTRHTAGHMDICISVYLRFETFTIISCLL